MKIRRILLLTEPRLLREMVERVIQKTPGLQIVGEVDDLADLAAMIEETGADWIILFLGPGEGLPNRVQDLLTSHPYVRVLTIARDGSQIEMKWVEVHAKALDRLNLDELISVLSNDYPGMGDNQIASSLGISFLGNISDVVSSGK